MSEIEEIKAYYGNLKATHAEFVSDMKVGRQTSEIWLLLDHIATLEAQNAALQARVDVAEGILSEAERTVNEELRAMLAKVDESPTAAESEE